MEEQQTYLTSSHIIYRMSDYIQDEQEQNQHCGVQNTPDTDTDTDTNTDATDNTTEPQIETDPTSPAANSDASASSSNSNTDATSAGDSSASSSVPVPVPVPVPASSSVRSSSSSGVSGDFGSDGLVRYIELLVVNDKERYALHGERVEHDSLEIVNMVSQMYKRTTFAAPIRVVLVGQVTLATEPYQIPTGKSKQLATCTHRYMHIEFEYLCQ
jgi:hypothetical protein